MQQISVFCLSSNQTVLSDTVDNGVNPAGRLWRSSPLLTTDIYCHALLWAWNHCPPLFLSSGYICQSNTQHLPVNPSCMCSPLANLSGTLLIVNMWLCPVVNSSPLHHHSICPFHSSSCCSVTSGNLARLPQNRSGKEQQAWMV